MTEMNDKCAGDPIFSLYEGNLKYIKGRTWQSDRILLLLNATARLGRCCTDQLSRFLGGEMAWQEFLEALAGMRMMLDLFPTPSPDLLLSQSDSMRKTLVSHIESIMAENGRQDSVECSPLSDDRTVADAEGKEEVSNG